MASLVGQLLKNIYKGLIITSDNDIITSTPKNITDGLGNASALSLGTNRIVVSGSLSVTSGMTGSLFGSASYAATSSITVSSSYALSASYAPGGSPFPFSGSAIITGSLNVTQGITGSLQGTSSFATRAVTASFSTNAITASYADNFTVAGTITAQKLVVQTITSSILYSSGSNIFGNNVTNVQSFTGSLKVTGSGSHYIVGGNVGIGTDTPNSLMHVKGIDAQILLESVSSGGIPTDETIQGTFGSIAVVKRMDGKFTYGNDVLLIGAFDRNSNFSGSLGIGLDLFESPQAALDIKSTTQGFLMPRMTGAQILNLMPYQGLQVYNTNINAFQYYDNTQWKTVGAPSYKVFTALLTQSGGDNPLSLSSQGFSSPPSLTIGVTYQIYDDGGSGWDFTNVGAPNNDLNTYFVATGTTPANWGTNGMLLYNTGAPTVTILENTIGNIWFEYNPFGYYYAKSIALFTANKTIVLNGGGFNQSIFYPSTVTTSYINDNAIIVASNGNNLLSNTTFEIKVYN